MILQHICKDFWRAHSFEKILQILGAEIFTKERPIRLLCTCRKFATFVLKMYYLRPPFGTSICIAAPHKSLAKIF
jgi:hypothetical protein